MERTTDLEVIRNRPRAFTWGTVLKVHDIGPYTIVEFQHREEGVAFHVYVDGKDTSNSTSTLESGLIYAIARKNLEVNEARWMAIGARKLLGLKEE